MHSENGGFHSGVSIREFPPGGFHPGVSTRGFPRGGFHPGVSIWGIQAVLSFMDKSSVSKYIRSQCAVLFILAVRFNVKSISLHMFVEYRPNSRLKYKMPNVWGRSGQLPQFSHHALGSGLIKMMVLPKVLVQLAFVKFFKINLIFRKENSF